MKMSIVVRLARNLSTIIRMRRTVPKVATEMALCVLTYNLTRVLNIVGVENLMEAIKA